MIRLLNWAGRPAVAHHFFELFLNALLEPSFGVSVHTLFRLVVQLRGIVILPQSVLTVLQKQLSALFGTESGRLEDLAKVLESDNELGLRGVLFLMQGLLVCGRDLIVEGSDRRRFAMVLEQHLLRVSRFWGGEPSVTIPGEGDRGSSVAGSIKRVLPERRFELRWWIELADIFRRCGAWDSGESWKILQRFWPNSTEQPVISAEPTETANSPEAVTRAEAAVDGLMQQLFSECIVEADPAIGFLLWHELADILISIAGRNRGLSKFRHRVLLKISGQEIPLWRGEMGSPQWEKVAAQKRMLMPARFVRYLDMCVRGWPSNSQEFRDLCDAAVHEVIRITYEDICPGNDRLEFIRSVQEILASVRNTVLAAMSDEGCEIDPLTLSEWMELLNHRLLIEQFLVGDGAQRSSEGSVVPPVRGEQRMSGLMATVRHWQ